MKEGQKMNESDYKITYRPKVEVKCPLCHRRIFDVLKGTRGTIKIKCPNCRTVSEVSVAFRLRTNHINNYYRKAS